MNIVLSALQYLLIGLVLGLAVSNAKDSSNKPKKLTARKYKIALDVLDEWSSIETSLNVGKQHFAKYCKDKIKELNNAKR